MSSVEYTLVWLRLLSVSASLSQRFGATSVTSIEVGSRYRCFGRNIWGIYFVIIVKRREGGVHCSGLLNMSSQSTIVDTKAGQAHVSTKSRWLCVFPMPHTGIMPYPCKFTDLKHVSVLIKWSTNDPAILATLHNAVIQLTQEFGVLGLKEIANTVRMTAGVAKTFGGDWHDSLKEAAREGATLPVPDDVLKYIKGFV